MAVLDEVGCGGDRVNWRAGFHVYTMQGRKISLSFGSSLTLYYHKLEKKLPRNGRVTRRLVFAPDFKRPDFFSNVPFFIIFALSLRT